MEGVTRLLYLLTTRNLWNAGIPPQVQGWGAGFHRGGGSLFLERMWLYHAAMILHLVHDLSDPWLILDEGRQPGQVWPGVLRLLRNFFFPEQPTRSPPPVPSRQRAAPAQPIYIITLPTIGEVSSDDELFGYSPRSTLRDDAPPNVTESEVFEGVEDCVEEDEHFMIFGPLSPRPGTMAIADEDVHGSVLPMSPQLHPPHTTVSFDEELGGPISPRRATPVVIVTLPEDDHFAPILPVETNELVNEVDHFPPMPPVVITEILDEAALFPPVPPVTVTEIFPDSDLV